MDTCAELLPRWHLKLHIRYARIPDNLYSYRHPWASRASLQAEALITLRFTSMTFHRRFPAGERYQVHVCLTSSKTLPTTLCATVRDFVYPRFVETFVWKDKRARIGVIASMDGFDWARIVLDELQPLPDQSSNGSRADINGARPRLLTRRSMRDLEGTRDEYAVQRSDVVEGGSVCFSRGHPMPQSNSSRRKASQVFPTFIERRVGIPIYEILSAEVTEGTCAPSFSSVEWRT